MDIHAKSVDMDMDMDMDGKSHINGIPVDIAGRSSARRRQTWCGIGETSYFEVNTSISRKQ